MNRRCWMAGLAAGVVMALLDGITNAALFSWESAYAAIGLSAKNPAIPLFWTAFDLVGGVVVAWLYDALSSRYGSGLGTALRAAGVPWFLVHLTLWSHLADGVFPPGILLGTSACELVSAMLGGVIVMMIMRPASGFAMRVMKQALI